MTDTPRVLPCGLALADDVALAPLTNTQSASDGTLSDDEFEWLRRRAAGGFRWVSTCAAFVSEDGHAWDGQLGISRDDHLPGLTRLAAALREHGANAVVQLHHGGPLASLAPNGPVGTADGDGLRGLTPAGIAAATQDFVRAALRAEQAGFSGVEVHGANGYLFTHFLSPLENPRTDAYGGDVAGRARFLRETVQAIREAVAPSFAVGVRLSPTDGWAKRGLTVADTAQVGAWLAEDGADFIHLSLGDAAGLDPADPGRTVAQGMRASLPAAVPIFAAGGIATRDDLRRARAAGVDVGVVGKAAIPHPDWPVVSRTDGWAPAPRPWSRDLLRAAAVGERFLDYISNFAGMVEGGAPPRG